MAYTNVALQARQRKQAALKKGQDNAPVFDDENEKLAYQFRLDCQTVSVIESRGRKAEKKAKLLPQYQGYMDGFLQNDDPPLTKQIFTNLIIWYIDAGLLDDVTPYILYAVEKELVLPEAYSRSLVTALYDELGATLKAGAVIGVENLQLIELALKEHDTVDQAKAKFLKEYGERLIAAGLKPEALAAFENAVSLNSRIGVKPQIANLKKELGITDK